MTQLLTLILTVSAAALTGLASAGLSFLIDYCLQPGEIFGRYLPWLAKKLLKVFKPELLSSIHARSYASAWNDEERDQAYTEAAAKNVALYKPLGGCIFCTGVWISFLTFIPIYIFFPIHWTAIFVHVAASHVLLRKLTEE